MNKLFFIFFLFVSLVSVVSVHAEEPASVQELMVEVKIFLDTGDISQAALTVKEILRIDPSNERAQMLLTRLNQQQASVDSEVFSKEVSDRFAEGEQLWKTGKFREAYHLFQGNNIHPPYYAALEKDFFQWQHRAQEQTAVQLRLVSQSSDPMAQAEKLKQILIHDPDATQASDRLAEIFQQLDQSAQPLWMKASTLHQLEGCSRAMPFYQKVKEATHFPEVPLWQKATLALSQCEGSSLTQK